MSVSDYAPVLANAEEQYGLPSGLLSAVMKVESGGDPNAIGPDTKYGRAQGAMQIIPATAKSLGIDATDPKQAIRGAAYLLAENIDRYGNIPDAVRAYHGGTDKTNWGPKTQAYANKVLSNIPQAQMDNDPVLQDYEAIKAAAPETPSATEIDPVLQDYEEIKASRGAGSANSTANAINAPAPSVPNAPQGGVENFGEGIGNFGAGIIHGALPVIKNVVHGYNWLQDKIYGHQDHPLETVLGALQGAVEPSYQKIANQSNVAGTGNITGQIAATLPLLGAAGEGLTAAGEGVPALNGVTSFLTGNATGGLLPRIASRGTAGAWQGAGANALTGNDPLEGAKVGGTVGAALPAIGAAANGVKNFITGGGPSPAVAQLAQIAENKYDIPISGAQISNSPFVHYLDSVTGKVPFSGGAERAELARSAFTKAVAGTFGEDADALTPEVMSNARSRIGSMFDQVAQNTSINADNAFMDKLGDIQSEAGQVLSDGEFSPVNRQINNLLDKIAPDDTIAGSTYQAMTRKGAPLDRAMGSSDPNVRYYANQIKETLDDALQRSASPQDLQTLQQARTQWKNMRTVQDLAAKAGIEGEITPANLLMAVKKSYKDMPYSGAGDIGELAQIGQRFLKEPPSSGSAERLALMNALKTIGGGVVGAAGYANPAATLASGTGIVAGSKIANMLVNSQLYKNMLLNAAMGGAPSTATNALLYGLPTAATLATNPIR